MPISVYLPQADQSLYRRFHKNVANITNVSNPNVSFLFTLIVFLQSNLQSIYSVTLTSLQVRSIALSVQWHPSKCPNPFIALLRMLYVDGLQLSVDSDWSSLMFCVTLCSALCYGWVFMRVDLVFGDCVWVWKWEWCSGCCGRCQVRSNVCLIIACHVRSYIRSHMRSYVRLSCAWCI